MAGAESKVLKSKKLDFGTIPAPTRMARNLDSMHARRPVLSGSRKGKPCIYHSKLMGIMTLHRVTAHEQILPASIPGLNRSGRGDDYQAESLLADSGWYE